MKCETSHITVWIPRDLLRKLDDHARQLRSRVPGVRGSRSDALRVLLVRGLEASAKEGAVP